MGEHIIDGEFQSDKYPDTPSWFVIEELQAEVTMLQRSLETVNTLNTQQQEHIHTLIINQGVRRRTNRSMSVKGVKTYEQTLESYGWTREEHFAELTAMDAELDKVQPEIAS